MNPGRDAAAATDRWLLLDDHPIFRFGLRQLVQRHWPAVRCVEAGTLAAGRWRSPT